jgi:PST family polysaccharide transporter
MTVDFNKAIKKSAVMKLATFIVQFIILMILSRMFTPFEFGVIASIQVFIIFFQMFSEIGIGPALVNEEHIKPSERDGVFTFTIFLGLLISIFFYGFSFLLNDFFIEYDYKTISILITISIFFSSLNIVPYSALVRELKFENIAIIEIGAQSISLVVTLILLFKMDPIIALASKTTTTSILKFIFTWYLSYFTKVGRPKYGNDFSILVRIKSFSIYQFCFSLINYFARNIDSILIAKVIGVNALGVYDRSYQIMRYPVLLTTGAFNAAIQPALTGYKHDLKYVCSQHNKLTERLLCIAIPLSIFIYTNSTEVTHFLMGEQWDLVIPLVEIFSISLPVQILISTSGGFFQAINKPKLLFRAGVIGALLFVISISISILFKDIYIVAWAVTFSFLVNTISIYYILFKYGFQTEMKPFIGGLANVLKNLLFPSLIYIVFKSLFEFNFLRFDVLKLVISLILLVLIYSVRKRFIFNLFNLNDK